MSCQWGHKVSLLVSPIVNFKIVINSENILCIQYIHLLSHNENTPYNFGIPDLYIKHYKNENQRIHISAPVNGWETNRLLGTSLLLRKNVLRDGSTYQSCRSLTNRRRICSDWIAGIFSGSHWWAKLRALIPYYEFHSLAQKQQAK